MQPKFKPILVALWLAVLVGLGGALYSAAARWQAETRNRAVEITVDIGEVRALAAAERKPISEILKGLKASGVHSISVQEETLSGLEESRRISIPPWPQRHETAVIPQDVQMAKRIMDSLQKKLGLSVRLENGTRTLIIPGDYTQVRGTGIGLDPETVTAVHNAKLTVVGRVSNFNGIQPDGIAWTLQELKQQGVRTVIFSGDEVLGYKGYFLDDPEKSTDTSTVSVLKDEDLWVGIVEFGKQKGDEELAKAAEDRVVRVHTVTGAEMLTANVPTNVQRFALAARERNIRLLYVRLFLDEKNPLEFNSDYIAKIVKGLERGNLELTAAHGYQELRVPLWCRALMGIGLAAAYMLVVVYVTGLLVGGWSGKIATLALIANLVIALGLMVLACLPGYTGVKLAAFITAAVYPTLAVVFTDLLSPTQGRGPTARSVGVFLLSGAITCLGAVTIIGLLADRVFLIKADAFAGIKVSQLIPLLVAALVYGLKLRGTPARPFDRAVREAGQLISGLANQPVLLWQVGGALVTLVILALLVLRSGNDPGVGVSPLELKIRALLDNLLYARPRFKEFLLGHPAFIVALVLAALNRRAWAMPLLLVGVIGQVSLLNTFCHLHTPILISLWRAILGIIIGLVFGVICIPLLRLPKLAPAPTTTNTTASGTSIP